MQSRELMENKMTSIGIQTDLRIPVYIEPSTPKVRQAKEPYKQVRTMYRSDDKGHHYKDDLYANSSGNPVKLYSFRNGVIHIQTQYYDSGHKKLIANYKDGIPYSGRFYKDDMYNNCLGDLNPAQLYLLEQWKMVSINGE